MEHCGFLCLHVDSKYLERRNFNYSLLNTEVEEPRHTLTVMTIQYGKVTEDGEL